MKVMVSECLSNGSMLSCFPSLDHLPRHQCRFSQVFLSRFPPLLLLLLVALLLDLRLFLCSRCSWSCSRCLLLLFSSQRARLSRGARVSLSGPFSRPSSLLSSLARESLLLCLSRRASSPPLSRLSPRRSSLALLALSSRRPSCGLARSAESRLLHGTLFLHAYLSTASRRAELHSQLNRFMPPPQPERYKNLLESSQAERGRGGAPAEGTRAKGLDFVLEGQCHALVRGRDASHGHGQDADANHGLAGAQRRGQDFFACLLRE